MGARAALLAWVLTACGPAGTTLIVEVRTDYRAGTEARAIEVRVSDADAVVHQARIPVFEGDELALGLVVAELPDLPAGPYDVLARVLAGSGETLAEGSARVLLDAPQRATIALAADCAFLTCPREGDASEATACLEGACVAPACASDARAACYGGPPDTLGVGACRAGTQGCEGGALGACEGEVVPADEAAVDVDEDCDGVVDEDVVLDTRALAIAPTPEGLAVVFTAARHDGEGGGFVYAARFDREGAPVVAPRALSAGDLPAIARGEEGLFVSLRDPEGALLRLGLDEAGEVVTTETLVDDASDATDATPLFALPGGATARALVLPGALRIVRTDADGTSVETTLTVAHEGRAWLALREADARLALAWTETVAEGTAIRMAVFGASGALDPTRTVETLGASPEALALGARDDGWIFAVTLLRQVVARDVDDAGVVQSQYTLRDALTSVGVYARAIAAEPELGPRWLLVSTAAETWLWRFERDPELEGWQNTARWALGWSATRATLAPDDAGTRLFVGLDVVGVDRSSSQLAGVDREGARVFGGPVWGR